MIALGIDWGEKYIGIAIVREGIALPVKTISAESDFLSEIESVCLAENSTDIVIGKPFASSGSTDNVSTRWADSKNIFIEWCQKRGITVHEIDERMTSALAKKMTKPKTGPRGIVSKTKKTDSSRRIDEHAAAILLQNFIDAGK